MLPWVLQKKSQSLWCEEVIGTRWLATSTTYPKRHELMDRPERTAIEALPSIMCEGSWVFLQELKGKILVVQNFRVVELHRIVKKEQNRWIVQELSPGERELLNCENCSIVDMDRTWEGGFLGPGPDGMNYDGKGKRVFWHLLVHVFGEAAEQHYICHLCLGPPTDDFFYEMAIKDRAVTNADYLALEKPSDSAIKDKQKFECLIAVKRGSTGNVQHMFFNISKMPTHLIPL
ncbi:uncharacterized protein BJ212DRAFT_1302030 [Suillus subaureus]|uniref:Uncharacterized protein n=1 Tax=Suillus subaureus TaxID=48587 RepID=A0A9P7E4M9_9AGAM|nr:uncharacterized protein BJ212DRAFT_1302030 [Suillus subaureus]KAG1811109.1 hypothetical protein BJ212DRAFT_1302030 [Suillus subaureus]